MAKVLKVLFWIGIALGVIVLINTLSLYLISRFTELALPAYLNYLYVGAVGLGLIILPFIGWGIKALVEKFKSRKRRVKSKESSSNKSEKWARILTLLLLILYLIFKAINVSGLFPSLILDDLVLKVFNLELIAIIFGAIYFWLAYPSRKNSN